MGCPNCGCETNPPGSGFCGACGARLGTGQTGPAPSAGGVQGRVCRGCGSSRTTPGGIPTWAVVAAVVGFCVMGVFSLLFLLVREPARCLDCGATLD